MVSTPKKQSYGTYLDSLLIDPNLINMKKRRFKPVFLIENALKKYRQIEQKEVGKQ
jgi:hypothetical protein